MDRFLNFVLGHNATIIEVLFGLTLLVVTFLAIRIFLFAKDPESPNIDLGSLEATLKQVIEKAGQVPVAGGNSEESQRLAAEISNLKTELEVKKKQIEEMSSAGAGAAPAAGISSEEKASLEGKLKELEAKLAEYEIISEDIADLSFYKEQNIKLQKEIETLKSGAGAVANPSAIPAAPAAAVEKTPEPVPEKPVETKAKAEPEIVGKASAVEQSSEPNASLPPETNPAPLAGVEPSKTDSASTNDEATKPTAGDNFSVDDDLMAEFAAAVAKQKGAEGDSAPAAEVNPTPTSTATSSPNSNSGEAKEVAPESKALAEVTAEKPLDASPKTEEPGVDLGQVDIDKMMVEAQEIKADSAEVNIDEALGQSVDESKLLKEAAAMNSVSQEDKQLMGEFENFVKKEG